MQLSWIKLVGFACACTGVLADVGRNAARAAVDQCQGSPDCQQVKGEVQTKVSNRDDGRRLQTGFASDPQAQQAMKESVANMAQTGASKVKVHMSEWPASAAAPDRRLASVTDVVVTVYSVLADNASHAQTIETALKSKSATDVTAELNKRLAANDETAYDVSATQHTVNPLHLPKSGRGGTHQIAKPKGPPKRKVSLQSSPSCWDANESDVTGPDKLRAQCAKNAIWARDVGIKTDAAYYKEYVNLTSASPFLEFQCMLWHEGRDSSSSDGHNCSMPCTPATLQLKAGTPLCTGEVVTTEPSDDKSAPPTGMPVWTWVLAAALLAIVIGILAYACCPAAKAAAAKKMKKRSFKAAPPAAAPAPAAPVPIPTTTARMPVYTYAAAPVTTAVAPPVYLQSQVMAAPASVSYAAPMTYAAPAASVSYAAPVTYEAPQQFYGAPASVTPYTGPVTTVNAAPGGSVAYAAPGGSVTYAASMAAEPVVSAMR